MITETLPQPKQPDVAKSAELYRGDINDAVIRAQQITGPEIDEPWWNQNVGNDGSTEDILDRFDAAYEEEVTSKQPEGEASLIPQRVEETEGSIKIEVQKEEDSWEQYAPIGSAEYEQANQERIKDGKIKVVELGRPDHSITLVASVKVDPETGKAVSGHEYNPEAESIADTQKAFEEYLAKTKPEDRVVIYEGDERLVEDRNEAIQKAADSGLVQNLASKENVPAISGEPSTLEMISVMERLGIKREELLAFRVAVGLETQMSSGEPDFIAGYINHQAAELGIEGFTDYTEAEKQAIVAEGRLDDIKTELAKKVETILPTLNELYRPALDNKDLFVFDGDTITINPEFNIDEIGQICMDRLNWAGDNRINVVAKLSMEMRDRTIFHRILETYRDGKSPFVVYGGSHVTTIQPALEAHFGN
jgi:hypothetical protein